MIVRNVHHRGKVVADKSQHKILLALISDSIELVVRESDQAQEQGSLLCLVPGLSDMLQLIDQDESDLVASTVKPTRRAATSKKPSTVQPDESDDEVDVESEEYSSDEDC